MLTLGCVGYKFLLSLGDKLLAQVISVYTGLCLVHIWVASWVVKFWYKRSVFTLGGVGYKFGLSLWW